MRKSVFSKFELPVNINGQRFLAAILQPTSTCNCLDGTVTLNRNLTVLFPAPDIWGHVVEFYFLLQKQVHLSFDRIFLAIFDKSSTEIQCRHRIKVFVGSGEATHHTELRIKKVLAMASVGNTIIDDLL